MSNHTPPRHIHVTINPDESPCDHRCPAFESPSPSEPVEVRVPLVHFIPETDQAWAPLADIPHLYDAMQSGQGVLLLPEPDQPMSVLRAYWTTGPGAEPGAGRTPAAYTAGDEPVSAEHLRELYDRLTDEATVLMGTPMQHDHVIGTYCREDCRVYRVLQGRRDGDDLVRIGNYNDAATLPTKATSRRLAEVIVQRDEARLRAHDLQHMVDAYEREREHDWLTTDEQIQDVTVGTTLYGDIMGVVRRLDAKRGQAIGRHETFEWDMLTPPMEVLHREEPLATVDEVTETPEGIRVKAHYDGKQEVPDLKITTAGWCSPIDEVKGWFDHEDDDEVTLDDLAATLSTLIRRINGLELDLERQSTAQGRGLSSAFDQLGRLIDHVDKGLREKVEDIEQELDMRAVEEHSDLAAEPTAAPRPFKFSSGPNKRRLLPGGLTIDGIHLPASILALDHDYDDKMGVVKVTLLPQESIEFHYAEPAADDPEIRITNRLGELVYQGPASQAPGEAERIAQGWKEEA